MTVKQPHVAVTGAAGYIGSRVVRDISEAHPDWTVTALDNFYRGQVEEIGDVPVDHVDIRDRDRLEDTLAGADIVMHLAAISGVKDCDENPDLAYEVNVQGTTNVAWFCKKTGAGLIFPFSMAVVGDPEAFPITIENPRDPMNLYGRTKLLNERTIDTLAEGAFPAHLFLKSNLYGAHEIGETRVSKPTVINIFVGRALRDQDLTVHEPGTQARNYVHVKDVARAYVRSAERLLTELDAGETGVSKFELAGDEDLSVIDVAELVQSQAAEVLDSRPDLVMLENPRDETLVERFDVETSRTEEELGWERRHSIKRAIRADLKRLAAGKEKPPSP
ncbi:NAD(P)-dependent oxidoreductase [Haladaptatus sp. DYSN1]|uniref:NAD-dependent epimerase/dehydratase family protein n=1 Tax=unclassified Haladaptatus TaxID=2622732 RepID=UPI0024057740|nr:NAD(P)-dependent oxidoreductase [Haladaptatus sp. DYSN1]